VGEIGFTRTNVVFFEGALVPVPAPTAYGAPLLEGVFVVGSPYPALTADA
jgi:hypothetical protein